MPDILFRRAKLEMTRRGVTFRDLVIDSLSKALDGKPAGRFVLREASAGYRVQRGRGVSSKEINRVIDEARDPGRTS